MNTALYIGIYTEGSTSKMRGEKLKSLLPGWKFQVIDTDIPFAQQQQPFRSLGFRYQRGPLITRVNEYIHTHLPRERCDLVWIDKAILITKKMTAAIRERTGKLVHYTPDTAFYGNRSKLFYESIEYYDYLVTTKSFEIEKYREKVPDSKVISTTQGFDADIHKPIVPFSQKKDRVAFVGLWEPFREKIIQSLIDNNINVALGGFKWDKFVRNNKSNSCLEFLGNSLWNKDYVTLISSSYFSLGLLSKRFPELHTTRTFEIPACGTALLTERNEETSNFFTGNEAIFYDSPEHLVQVIQHYRSHTRELEQITHNGHEKVNTAGLDYRNILGRIIKQVI